MGHGETYDGHRGRPVELETIDLAPLHPQPPPSPSPTRPAPPPRSTPRARTSRPHRLPPPPETDVSFRRWVFAPLEVCEARLERWAAAAPTSRRVARSQVSLRPRRDDEPDRRHLRVLLHRGWHRSLPMDLALDRSCAPFGTQLTLRPQHEIRSGRRYFREGHAVLDALEQMLDPEPVPPGAGGSHRSQADTRHFPETRQTSSVTCSGTLS